MKVVTAANGNKKLTISHSEWTAIGEKIGWCKTALAIAPKRPEDTMENRLKRRLEKDPTSIPSSHARHPGMTMPPKMSKSEMLRLMWLLPSQAADLWPILEKEGWLGGTDKDPIEQRKSAVISWLMPMAELATSDGVLSDGQYLTFMKYCKNSFPKEFKDNLLDLLDSPHKSLLQTLK